MLGSAWPFLRARKTDETTDTKMADNFTYLTPKKRQIGFWPPYKKGGSRESGNVPTPGVLHAHECCINAATKNVPFSSVHGRFGRLQRVRDTRERLIADKKGAGGARIASDGRGEAREDKILTGYLRRS